MMDKQTAYIPPLMVDRSLAVYHFESGGFVAIVTGGPIVTRAALDMAKQLLAFKEAELAAIPPHKAE